MKKDNNGFNYSSVENQLRKNARKVNREYRRKNLMIRLTVVISVFFIICWFALQVSQKYAGSFEINLDNGRRSLSLSVNPEFSNPSDVLFADIPQEINNISYTYIPLDIIGEVNGSANGRNYMCYTFYLKNTGNRTLDYTCAMKILNYEKGLDECIRIMIVRNGETSYYAKCKHGTDGEPELVYYYDDHARFDEVILTEAFVSDEEVFTKEYTGLTAGNYDKYSVVVWIEGSDPETNNEKLHGVVRMKIDFNVIENEEEDM